MAAPASGTSLPVRAIDVAGSYSMAERPALPLLHMLVVAFSAAVAWACPISIGPFFRKGGGEASWSALTEAIFHPAGGGLLGLLPVALLATAWLLGGDRPGLARSMLGAALLASAAVVLLVLLGLAGPMLASAMPST